MSFSEIYFVEHEIALLKKQKKPFFTLPRIIIGSGLIILILSTITTYFLIMKDTKDEIKKIDPKTLIKTTPENKKQINDPNDFKILAKIEFSDNNSPKTAPFNQEDNKKEQSTPKPMEKITVSNNKNKTQNNIQPFFFEILAKGLNKKDAIKIKTEIKDKTVILKENNLKKETWNVYIEKKGGNIKIGENSVEFIKGFSDKNSAIKFAQQLNKKVFIKKEITIQKTFDVSISPFNTEQEASTFAKSRPLKVKSLKIIKKY